MLFVRQAGTPGTRRAWFPMVEDPDPAGLTAAARLAESVAAKASLAYTAPWPAAAETARALGFEPEPVDELTEADYGRWRGRAFADIAQDEPEALTQWLADPEATPHGGESQAALARRVAGWLDEIHPGVRTVVVCDAGPIRAALAHALGIPLVRAALVDLAPLSATELTATRTGWRVAYVNRKGFH
ncbi:histidine phosphatase family protein [Streptosporangiaceae bacterium NEAU-GS5]|nr:histidine phosphatase family protein [Streptosporangiaceae bacterium NEAU-GS5]